LGDIFGHNNVYIRLLPGGQNGGVLSGLSFTNICSFPHTLPNTESLKMLTL